MVTFLISVTRLSMRVAFCIFAMGSPGRNDRGVATQGHFHYSSSPWLGFPPFAAVVDIWNCRFVTLGMDGWEETQRRERKEHRSHVVAVFLEGICGVCGHLAILAKEVLSSNFFFSLSYQYWTVYVFGFSGNWTEFSCDHSSGTQFCQQILKNTLAYP